VSLYIDVTCIIVVLFRIRRAECSSTLHEAAVCAAAESITTNSGALVTQQHRSAVAETTNQGHAEAAVRHDKCVSRRRRTCVRACVRAYSTQLMLTNHQ
jgi:hypothetical protein